MAMNSKNTRLLLQKLCTRQFRSVTNTLGPANPRPRHLQEIPGLDWRAVLEKDMRNCCPEEKSLVCIYKVPTNMRQVDAKAYTPNIVSIGPYHRGSSHLQEMEKFKRRFLCRLFNRNCFGDGLKLEPVIDALEGMEEEARSHYSEEVELSSDEFVEMMLVDGCFIVELLRELEKHKFTHGSALIERWMLPILRRDLIMLENQLPLSVLQRLFQITSSEQPNKSLQELAIRFFIPLLQRNSKLEDNVSPNEKGSSCFHCSTSVYLKKGFTYNRKKHFLDLFRSSILPTAAVEAESTQMENIREECTVHDEEETYKASGASSAKELKKHGIKFEKGKKCCLPMDIQSEGRGLIIPPLFIDDYRGTLLRNLVAYEQRHGACKPQVTAYMFFLDGLINTAEDVELLRRQGVIQHSLGRNEDVAVLVNGILKEVSRDNKESSYLHKVLWDVHFFLNTSFAMLVAPILNHYFGSLVLRISTAITIVVFSVEFILKANHNASDPESTSFSP